MGNRPNLPDGWSQDDREAFWEFVRLRMAKLRLNQDAVAGALGMDRTALGRRLNKHTRERPDEQAVASLAAPLKLTPEECEHLRGLAGLRPRVAIPASPDEADVDASADESSGVRREDVQPTGLPGHNPTRRGIAFVAGATLAIALAAAAAVWPGHGHTRSRSSAQPSTTVAALRSPGGLWISPANGDEVHGAIAFAARAYATGPDDPAVAYVVFTVSWDGRAGPWLVACRVAAPSRADQYTCTWDPATMDVPAGPLHVSFDVYDRATPTAHAKLAPHGTRTITYAPAGD